MQEVFSFLRRVFEEADDDLSGSLSFREFKNAFSRRETQEQMERLGLSMRDVNVLFEYLDKDKSGDVSVDEIITGFAEMKRNSMGLTRVIAFLEQVFQEADVSGDGELDTDEFVRAFSQPAVLGKLG